MDAPAIFDLDIGSDPDDTWVAAMVAGDPGRFRPALLLTNDETTTQGRARFLAGLVARADSSVRVAAGRPSLRRRTTCLVEDAGLAPAKADFDIDGVGALLKVLEAHPTVDYFGLGALTNLDAALSQRPDLAERVRLVQMGPALLGAYRRSVPQYNARLDPLAFARVLARVRRPTLLLSHCSWSTFGPGLRAHVGIYPDDPLAVRLAETEPSSTTRLYSDHLRAWVASGKPGSIFHDPLTVLSALEPGLVEYTEVELHVGGDGWAQLAESSRRSIEGRSVEHLGSLATSIRDPSSANPSPGFAARISLRIEDAARARQRIVEGLLGPGCESLVEAWAEHNRARPEPTISKT